MDDNNTGTGCWLYKNTIPGPEDGSRVMDTGTPEWIPTPENDTEEEMVFIKKAPLKWGPFIENKN